MSAHSSMLAALCLLAAAPALQAEEAAVSPASSAGQPLTLERAVQLASEKNGDLIRSGLQAVSSEQDKLAARAVILPSLDFNASFFVGFVHARRFAGRVLAIPAAAG